MEITEVSPTDCIYAASSDYAQTVLVESPARLRCIDPVKFCSCCKGDDVAMSETVAEEIKRWTAKRTSALVIEIIQGKTT
ncbi:MAG: hypothetical protein AAGC57_21525, partial [Pseudomonadota bacterium]